MHFRGLSAQSPRPLLWTAGGLFFCLALAGCGTRTFQSAPAPDAQPADDAQTLAPGIVHRAIATGNGTGVDIVDVDTTRARAAFHIATENIGRADGMIGGSAYTPDEWLAKTYALAAVNGGYFGREDTNGRKEFIGLLVQQHKVRHAAPPIAGHGTAGTRPARYVRAALGIGPDGMLQITWAGTQTGHPQALRRYSNPDAHDGGAAWNISSAVGCGPILIQNGHIRVTDRQERLASDGALPRTFAAYDTAHRHQLVGIASGMEYRTLAAWIVQYFATCDHTQAQAAMCLDGGASTQMSYRKGSQVLTPRATGVSVPDAIVIVPRP